MGRPWAHSCCGLRLSRPNGHILRHCGLHPVRGSLQTPQRKCKRRHDNEISTQLLRFSTLSVYVRFRDTPVVKSSSRELCYIILAGICLGYLCTFSLIAKPHVIHCYLQRLGIGLSPAMSYSALVTKVSAGLQNDREDADKSVGRSRTGTNQEESGKLGTGLVPRFGTLSLFFHPYGLSCLWPLLLWK